MVRAKKSRRGDLEREDAVGSTLAVSASSAGVRLEDNSESWLMFDALPLGACVHAPDGIVLYANPALGRLTGWNALDLVGLPVGAVVPDARFPLGNEGTRIAHYRRRDGTTARVAETVAPIVSRGGWTAALRTATDLTPLDAEASPDGSRLRTILEQSPIGVSVSRRDDGTIVFANARFAELVGLPVEAIVGTRAASFYIDESHRERVVERLRGGGSVVNLEIPFRRADGSAFWALFTVNDAVIDGVPVNLAWIYDYTERRRMEETLREMASRDSLTGAYNRRSFLELARQHQARVRRSGEPLSILVLDIDHFKPVNDTLGHAAGDEALRGVARSCGRVLRDYDLLGRLGGDEFAIVLPGVAAQEALGVAERLRRDIARIPIVAGGVEFSVSVSIGIACIDDPRDDVETAIHRADRALYRSKRLGRNRSSIFRPEEM
jgi:diguanylate cyclase (GGDEF)-like protein/PAS domain S-box-containing protein